MILNGTNGNNVLNGTSAADTIYGKGGYDTLYGKGGADTLDGGASNDFLYGAAGNDRLYGGDGNDYLDDAIGQNNFNGGYGADFITGRGYMVGGHGSDDLRITAGQAFGDNPDVPNAVGNDRLSTDLAQGAGAWRSLNGGGGADYFSVTMSQVAHTPATAVITDFNPTAGDRLALSVRMPFEGDVEPVNVEAMNYFDTNHDNVIDDKDGSLSNATRDVTYDAATGDLTLRDDLGDRLIVDNVHAIEDWML